MARKLPPLSGKAKNINSLENRMSAVRQRQKGLEKWEGIMHENGMLFYGFTQECDPIPNSLLRNRDSSNNVIYPYDFVSQWINAGQPESNLADNVFVTDSTDIGFRITRIYNQEQMLAMIDETCSRTHGEHAEALRRFLICKLIPIGSDVFNSVVQEIINLYNPNEFELGIKNIALRNNQ